MKTPKMPKVARPVFAPPPAPVANIAQNPTRPGATTFGSTGALQGLGSETLLTSTGRKPELLAQRRTLLGG